MPPPPAVAGFRLAAARVTQMPPSLEGGIIGNPNGNRFLPTCLRAGLVVVPALLGGPWLRASALAPGGPAVRREGNPFVRSDPPGPLVHSPPPKKKHSGPTYNRMLLLEDCKIHFIAGSSVRLVSRQARPVGDGPCPGFPAGHEAEHAQTL